MFRKSTTAEGEEASTSESKTVDDLREVIRYQRSKAQIAETECEQAKLECQRLTQRCTHVQRQLDETRDLLTLERERTQTSVITAHKHDELMAKVEKLHLLTDSNKLLRDENEKMEVQIKEYEAKLKKLNEEAIKMAADHTEYVVLVI